MRKKRHDVDNHTLVAHQPPSTDSVYIIVQIGVIDLLLGIIFMC